MGRGKGALLNLDDVARWRADCLGVSHKAPDNVLERIEMALLDVLRRDGGDGRPIAALLGLTNTQAAILLTHALSRITRALNGGG